MRTTLQFSVVEVPGPQGSKGFKGFSKAGRAILAESSTKVKPWRAAVVEAARDAMAVGGGFAGPVKAYIVFTVRKPTSAPKKRRTWPSTKPDLDKLLRSTFDALKTAGVIEDDARVVELERAAKVYPNEDPYALDVPGAVIRISSVEARLDRVTQQRDEAMEICATRAAVINELVAQCVESKRERDAAKALNRKLALMLAVLADEDPPSDEDYDQAAKLLAEHAYLLEGADV